MGLGWAFGINTRQSVGVSHKSDAVGHVSFTSPGQRATDEKKRESKSNCGAAWGGWVSFVRAKLIISDQWLWQLDGCDVRHG